MKQFLINEEQIKVIANVLLEVQAKLSLNALDALRNLQEYAPPSKPEGEDQNG